MTTYCTQPNPIYPPGEDYGNPKAWAAMMEWQFVWLKTVARVWEEWDKPDAERQFSKELLTGNDLHTFYEKWFKYNLSTHLTLRVELADAPYDPCETDKWFKNRPHGQKPLTLTMLIPQPPVKKETAAYNLASYADSGRTYPFTCC